MTEKGVPKRDGTGMGKRNNRGRGGCDPQEDKGLKDGQPRPRGRGRN